MNNYVSPWTRRVVICLAAELLLAGQSPDAVVAFLARHERQLDDRD